MHPRRIAVVIPTLDEAEAVAANLPAALAIADQLILSDGGSRDETVEIARRLGAEVVSGTAGRGPQLNRGASLCRSDILLFLHADTCLPPEAGEHIRHAVGEGAVGGAFQLRFDSQRSLLRLGSRLVNWRSRWLGVPLGDQAQFVTREAFAALGGFRSWPILEDLDFILRLKRHGRIAILPGPAVTSARRFEGLGIARTVARNWLIWGLFLAGVSPCRLGRLYRR